MLYLLSMKRILDENDYRDYQSLLDEAERDDWSYGLPDHDLDWAEWWHNRTFPSKFAARIGSNQLPFNRAA